MACEERLRRGHWPRILPQVAKTFTAVDLGSGAPGWQVPLGGLKAFDALQRHGHVARYLFSITATIAAGTGTVRGFDLASVLQQLSLRDAAAWEYFSGLDGRDMIDDYLFRTGRLPWNQNANITLQAGTAQSVTFLVPIELRTRPAGDAQYWEEHPLDGCIPLALLDNRNNAAAVLSGQWAATLPKAAGGTVAVTITACTCLAGLYYDEDAVSDAPWVIDVQKSTVKPFVIEIKGQRDGHAIHYSMLRHRTEETGGVELGGDYTALKVDHGADNFYAGLTAAQALQHLFTVHPLHHSDDNTFVATAPTINNAVLLGTGTVEVVPLMFSGYGATRAQMGAGPITFDFTTAGHSGGARVQSRIISPASLQYQSDVARILGISTDQLVQKVMGGGKGNPDKIAALLPRKLQRKG